MSSDGASPPPASPRRRTVPLIAFALLCVALAAGDLLVARHGDHGWDHVLGFYGLYGFVACVVLVLAAKVLRRLVMQPEEYWDDARR